MKSYQRSSCKRASLRKADAKVVLLHIPTKQNGKYFTNIFVNKPNSLGLREDGEPHMQKERGETCQAHLLLYTRIRAEWVILLQEQ